MLLIFDTLAKDPVSQMCLGLTNRQFHKVFYATYASACASLGLETYNSKVRPWDLRMCVSADETAILYGWIPFYNELNDGTILWQPSLGDLLLDERSLWRGMSLCEGCLKYKPDTAWDMSTFEMNTLNRHHKEFECIEHVDVLWYKERCARCRAKALLVAFEKRLEAWEDDVQPEEAACVGLWLPGRIEALLSEKSNPPAVRKLYGKNGRNYEPWEEVFDRLGL